MNERCDSCRFWGDVHVYGEDRGSAYCRRHAPRGEQYWATTRPDDWCGEHEPIEGDDEAEEQETLDSAIERTGDGNAL
jgi:hypothetical protein